MDWKKFLKPTKEKLTLFTILSITDLIAFSLLYLTTCWGCVYSFEDYFLRNAVININIITLLSASVLGSSYFFLPLFFLFWYAISCCAVFLYEMFKKKPKVLWGILLSVMVLIAVPAYLTAQSQYQKSRYSLGIQIMDSYCIGGNDANILVRNTGTQKVNLAPGGDVTVINTTSGSDPGGSWYDLNSNVPLTEADPGQVVRYNVSCSSFCLFRILVGGRIMTASVQC